MFDRSGHTIVHLVTGNPNDHGYKERKLMNKLDLIQTLSTTNGISKTEATNVVTMFFEEMASSLEKGTRVEIRGLCTFDVKNYEEYRGRNPKTGEPVQVKPKRLPYFKCGKELKERVDK